MELGNNATRTPAYHWLGDAFYAAVEELDRPELRDVPMAVGKGVLTTCNYHARKFGCRSGMAGFVAMKLCPQLICLPLDFLKYSAKAEEVRAVLANYDPRFESASVDEAYLNITEYCAIHEMSPEDAVSQLRDEVHAKTKITVSAGIAANAKLAKICSNINKPNGQFHLAPDRNTIMQFMRDLPTRKVNGIGRVFERELDAIGINTCGDIYSQRAYLSRLFGEKAFQFLMQCYLGLGRTRIQPAGEYERKSVGTETTFRELGGKAELREKLSQVAAELEKDLDRTQYKGRTLVLKVKLHTFEVLTRQTAPPFAVYKREDLYKYALPMLARLEKEVPSMRLRLMGLRVTHIVSRKNGGIDFFGLNKRRPAATSNPVNEAKVDDQGEWEVWPEAEFEEAARQEIQDDMNELEALSQEQQETVDPTADRGAKILHNGAGVIEDPLPATEQFPSNDERWTCPVCARPQPADDREFNSHIDSCLSRQTIKDVVKDVSAEPSSSTTPQRPASPFSRLLEKGKPVPPTRKRGRPRNDALVPTNQNIKRRAFFTRNETV